MGDLDALVHILGLIPPTKSPEILIYTKTQTPRLHAACEFIFNTALQCQFRFVEDSERTVRGNQVLINYSSENRDSEFQIVPSGFLTETGTASFEPAGFEMNGQTYFFRSGGQLGFDIFSAVFYFISRYEEWQAFEADEHKRFELANSLLFKHNLHKQPILEIWVNEFAEKLRHHSNSLLLPGRAFRVISTMDIDNLYAFRSKGFARTVGASIKDLLKLDLKNFTERLKVLLKLKNDPFDRYDEISDFCFEKKIPFFCFFLQRTGTKYDRTVNPTDAAFSNVIRALKKNHAFIGLHPSYGAFNNQKVLQNEIHFLKNSSGSQIQLSRQHYLRYDTKITPYLLIEEGIKFDFTMGFASGIGFRAGTSLPFKFYDFKTEQVKDLILVPFCAMDGAFSIYGTKDSDQALLELQSLAQEVRNVNGLFTTVFHERSFYDHLYKGFGTLYKNLHGRLGE